MDYSELFATLTPELIEDWISSGRQEDLFLDFKQISRPDLSDKSDRKNFAKVLSGFANSAGGIVVWGVDARPDRQTGIDAATAASPIDRLSLFCGKLEEFTGTFVSPLVDGVRHRTLPTKDDSGFAATLIPMSDAGPHMALGGEGRYYKRSGSSFYPMEHFDLEDMFGRRRKAILQLTCSPRLRHAL